MSASHHIPAPAFAWKHKYPFLEREALDHPRTAPSRIPRSYPIAADRAVEDSVVLRWVAQKCTPAAVEAEVPGYCAVKC